MATQITSLDGMKAAWSAWLARDGDADIAARADDLLALVEQRLYYGAEALPALGVPEMQALRIPEMEQVDTNFQLQDGAAQPDGFLELITARLNANSLPLDIVEQSVIDAYGTQAGANLTMIAVSGVGFRCWPPQLVPSATTLRWYGKFATPTSSQSNWLLSTVPGIYLNGGLLEASIFIGDADSAKLYASLFASLLNGLNNRKNRILASAQNLRMRVRGRTP